MTVELESELADKDMLLDFKHVKRILSPLVEQWDHAVLIAKSDEKLKEAMAVLDSKTYVLPYDSTAEHLCAYVANYLLDHGREALLNHQIDRVTVRLEETETCYAEVEKAVAAQNGQQSESHSRERRSELVS
jgi:6-pyruvoyltetrahydropterin/6-carboxytetrahydropterin synthase